MGRDTKGKVSKFYTDDEFYYHPTSDCSTYAHFTNAHRRPVIRTTLIPHNDKPWMQGSQLLSPVTVVSAAMLFIAFVVTLHALSMVL